MARIEQEFRDKAKAEGLHMFSLMIDGRYARPDIETLHGKSEWAGACSPEMAAELHAFMRKWQKLEE